MPHMQKYTLFRRWSSQPITWLILTNKTVQKNTQTKHNSKSKQHKIQQKKKYPGSVTSHDTRPRNVTGLFYNPPKPTWSLTAKLSVNNMACISQQVQYVYVMQGYV